VCFESGEMHAEHSCGLGQIQSTNSGQSRGGLLRGVRKDETVGRLPGGAIPRSNESDAEHDMSNAVTGVDPTQSDEDRWDEDSFQNWKNDAH